MKYFLPLIIFFSSINAMQDPLYQEDTREITEKTLYNMGWKQLLRAKNGESKENLDSAIKLLNWAFQINPSEKNYTALHFANELKIRTPEELLSFYLYKTEKTPPNIQIRLSDSELIKPLVQEESSPYLKGLYLVRLFELTQNEDYLAEAKEHFIGCDSDKGLSLIGMKEVQRGNLALAYQCFEHAFKIHPSNLAHFYLMRTCFHLSDQEGVKTHHQFLMKQNQDIHLAEEGLLYPKYHGAELDSVIGEAEKKFPKSPFLALLWYQKGLEEKKNDHLKSASSLFDKAFEHLFALSDKNDYFKELMFRIGLDSIEINSTIAQTAKGAKALIYREYAKTTIRSLKEQIDPSSFYTSSLQELDFLESVLCLQKGETEKALCLLDQSIAKFNNQKISKNGYLLRSFQAKGDIYREKGSLEEALDLYKLALEAFCKETTSSTVELALRLKLSYCYESLERYDEALKNLSYVVNAPLVSPLRIEAMYSRAEIWESMGRIDLAIRQWQAVAKLGGHFAELAHKKLDHTPFVVR